MLPLEVWKRFELKAKNTQQACSCKGKGCFNCGQKNQSYFKMANSNIPLKFWDLEISDFYGSIKIKNKIEQYITNLAKAYEKGIGLFLQGQNGRGKSMMASLILKAALNQGYTTYMTTLSDAITMFAGSWYDKKTEEQFKYQIISADFLVVDELGKELRSSKKESNQVDLAETAFNSFFRRRADLYLPTIICSNKRVEEIEFNYGKSLLALFDEHIIAIRFEGKDYRKEIAPKLEKEVFTNGPE